MSLFSAGSFLDPKQLEAAKTDGLKKINNKFLINLVGLLQLCSTASSS